MTNDELLSRITVDPNICNGRPCIRGLPYTVAFILEELSNGLTVPQLLARHPELQGDDISAAFAYGVRATRLNPAVPPVKMFAAPMAEPFSRNSISA